MNKSVMSAHKVQGKRKIIVTLDDPNISKSGASMPVIPYMFDLPDVFDAPTLVTGWFLPNRFKVEGFDDDISITVGRVKVGSVDVLRCTSIEVNPRNPGDALTLDERLPLATFVELATIASQVLCVAYPPGYVGDVLGANLKPMTEPGKVVIRGTNKWGHIEAVAWGTEVNTAKVRAMTGKAKPPKSNDRITDQVLREVATVYADAPNRKRYEVLYAFLRKRVNYAYTPGGMKEIVRRATEAGYIKNTKQRGKR